MYVVFIEWDGKQPPTKYYNRMRQLRLRIRGNKDITPAERRAFEGSTIVQEGCVLCASESLAYTVAREANDCGARSVAIGQTDISPYDPFRISSVMDEAVYDRIEAAFSKRGRPPKSENVEVCAICKECLHVQHTSLDDSLQCKSCNGLDLILRQSIVFYSIPTSDDVFDNWLRSRFANGIFVPQCNDTGPLPPENTAGDEVSEKMALNVDLRSYINAFPQRQSTWFFMLDRMYAARKWFSVEKRSEPRVKACINLFRLNINEVDMMEDDNVVDFLDAAVYSVKHAADAMISYLRSKP